MLDVMIIDDDRQVRDRLKMMIDWQQLPIRLVCEAGDSDTAWELYYLYRPKIVITDINIPIISGLELAKKMAETDPEIRFIVITGYNDFEFVRQSVKLGAIDLLAKPIFTENIHESLIKAIRYFERRKEERASVASLRQLLAHNLPMIQEAFLARLLQREPYLPAEIPAKLRELHIDCPGPFFTAALLVTSEPKRPDQSYEGVNALLRDMAGDLLQAAGLRTCMFFDANFRVSCILSSTAPSPGDLIEDALSKLSGQYRFLTDCTCFAGIGRTVTHPALLHESCDEALTALNYQQVLSDDTVIHYKNIEQFDARTELILPTSTAVFNRLVQPFRMNDLAKISETISQYARQASERRLRDFLFQYVAAITAESIRMGVEVEQVESFSVILGNLFHLHEAKQQVAYVLKLTESLLKLVFTKRASSTNHLISMAKTYIREHLANETLDLDLVSEHVGLSRIYFCKLFHKEEGISFNNYLKSERVEQAKRLLTRTNGKVFEISVATGFSNAKYFGYVFKSVVGLTPLEYQKKHLKEQ